MLLRAANRCFCRSDAYEIVLESCEKTAKPRLQVRVTTFDELVVSIMGYIHDFVPPSNYLITGGLASLLNAILLHNHSTASCTPVPVSALQGSTLLSLTFPPFSPSNTLLTKPSLILTTSTQSSRSCLFASINIGTPLASSFASTLSKTNLHSSNRPISSMLAALFALMSASVALPTSLLSITKTMA